MLINADIGEMMGNDELIVPFIGMGNIACGGHAGTDEHMKETVRLLKQHEVKICAHPGYCDKENFGRVSVNCSREDLSKLIGNQVRLLSDICQLDRLKLSAIKPHGALYHDMMHNKGGMVRDVLVSLAKEYKVPLVVQAGFEDVEWGIDVLYEVFADRGYRPNGEMMPRSLEGSLYSNSKKIVEQASQFIAGESIQSYDGIGFSLEADTLCFHGDNLPSVEALKLLS